MTRAPRRPYMPFFGDDFFGSQAVRMMSHESRGVLLELLWLAWRDGSIPSDRKLLTRLLGAGSDLVDRCWPEIESLWQPAGDGRLVNQELEDERSRQDEHRRRMSEAGKRGNSVRWGSQDERSPSDRGEAIASDRSHSHPIPVQGGSTPLPPLNAPGRNGHSRTPRREPGDPDPGQGGGGVGKGWNAFNALVEIGYRSRSKARSAAVLQALRKFQGEGGGDTDLQKLIHRAKSNSNGDPAALLSSWLDKGDWRKEIT